MIVRVMRLTPNDAEAEAWLIKYLNAREERVTTRTRRTFAKTDLSTLQPSGQSPSSSE
jgi:hypothetical protein